MTLAKTRRELLLDGLRAAGALAAAGLLGPEPLHAADETQHAARGFSLGVCDWSIARRSQPAALDVAQKLGLDGIQVDLGDPGKMALLQPEVQQKYLAKMKETGMKIPSLALGTLNMNPYWKADKAQQWVADAIDVCAPLGAGAILLAFFGPGDLRTDPDKKDLRPDPKKIATTIAKLKEIAPKAEKAKVKLLVESMLDAPALMRIVNAVGSPAVGVYYDVGNAKHAGYDIVNEIRMLGKHIGEFHAKDYKGTPGRGEVDFPAVRQAMDAIGYRRWIQFEDAAYPPKIKDSFKDAVQYLRQIFPKEA